MLLANEDKEWIANLIAASEARTAGAIAASETRSAAAIERVETALLTAIVASEGRSAAAIERVETALLTEFHKWAPQLELRVKSHSLAIQAIDLEIDNLAARLRKLEPTQ